MILSPIKDLFKLQIVVVMSLNQGRLSSGLRLLVELVISRKWSSVSNVFFLLLVSLFSFWSWHIFLFFFFLFFYILCKGSYICFKVAWKCSLYFWACVNFYYICKCFCVFDFIVGLTRVLTVKECPFMICGSKLKKSFATINVLLGKS